MQSDLDAQHLARSRAEQAAAVLSSENAHVNERLIEVKSDLSEARALQQATESRVNELREAVESERQARTAVETELAVVRAKELPVLPVPRQRKNKLDGNRQQQLLPEANT
jgi:chromosome segregation ATPase